MATIDVVSLDASEGDAVIESRSEEQNDSTNGENTEKARKKGRPAGAKDVKRRKTPVRKKMQEAPKKVLEPSTPVAPMAPVTVEPVVAPIASAPAAVPTIMPSTSPVQEMTPFQQSRLKYLERQSMQQAHWDGIVAPMFRYPIY